MAARGFRIPSASSRRTSRALPLSTRPTIRASNGICGLRCSARSTRRPGWPRRRCGCSKPARPSSRCSPETLLPVAPQNSFAPSSTSIGSPTWKRIGEPASGGAGKISAGSAPRSRSVQTAAPPWSKCRTPILRRRDVACGTAQPICRCDPLQQFVLGGWLPILARPADLTGLIRKDAEQSLLPFLRPRHHGVSVDAPVLVRCAALVDENVSGLFADGQSQVEVVIQDDRSHGGFCRIVAGIPRHFKRSTVALLVNLGVVDLGRVDRAHTQDRPIRVGLLWLLSTGGCRQGQRGEGDQNPGESGPFHLYLFPSF